MPTVWYNYIRGEAKQVQYLKSLGSSQPKKTKREIKNKKKIKPLKSLLRVEKGWGGLNNKKISKSEKSNPIDPTLVDI